MGKILKILSGGLMITILIVAVVTSYIAGFLKGSSEVAKSAQRQIDDYISKSKSSSVTIPKKETPKKVVTPTPMSQKPSWGGPQLWEAVNKRRTELGVNPLSQRNELCAIASIRLNQLLELGKLDGHEGFSKLPETRPDLKWIFEKYNLSEFLVTGAASPQESVSLWENTLGHKQLLSGGEYVWGCTYAQSGFGVAIAAY